MPGMTAIVAVIVMGFLAFVTLTMMYFAFVVSARQEAEERRTREMNENSGTPTSS